MTFYIITYSLYIYYHINDIVHVFFQVHLILVNLDAKLSDMRYKANYLFTTYIGTFQE